MLFAKLSKHTMVVQRESALSEVPGGATYAQPTTPDSSTPGMVFVHLLTPTGFLKSGIQDLMCHEGVPGHPFQGDIVVRQTGVPKFRTAYSYAAYNESWGLHAEGLCKEMGLYPDAYTDYARLDAELWRAVRLVVDTGLHAKGWNEAEGVKYAPSEYIRARRENQRRSAALAALARTDLRLQDRAADLPAAARRGRRGIGNKVRRQGVPRHGDWGGLAVDSRDAFQGLGRLAESALIEQDVGGGNSGAEYYILLNECFVVVRHAPRRGIYVRG
jgi:Bacterial protein of unknown function (DUF885)